MIGALGEQPACVTNAKVDVVKRAVNDLVRASVSVFGASVFCASVFGASIAGSAAAGAPVRTDAGLIQGLEEAGLQVFKGVPFAAPPVGPLRWRPPERMQAWPGVRRADRFPPECPQVGAYPDDAPPEPMSEDCLYLNIWTPPAAANARFPVMVWIYGGGLMNGSASTPLYAGDRLARRGVVVVTANYRLGALGFLAHPELTRDSGQQRSGNYGFLDQIAALAWVHRNIVAFGGDPGNVTVFGQSSGSISISALTTSPLARGLFQRVIGESGGLFEPLELAPQYRLRGAEREGTEFVERAGAGGIQALRALPASEIVKIGFAPHLVIDGYALTEPPYEAYLAGRQSPIDLLVGSNADEGAYFLKDRQITAAGLNDALSHDFSKPVVSLIGPRGASSDAEARAAYVRFEGDMRFRWDMWTWARLQARTGRPGFFYDFARVAPYRSASRLFGLGAAHGAEMPYVFGHLDPLAASWTDQDRRLSEALLSYWTNFAKTGDPNGPGLPDWPQFTPSDPRSMRLDQSISTGPTQDLADLDCIDRLYASVRIGSPRQPKAPLPETAKVQDRCGSNPIRGAPPPGKR